MREEEEGVGRKKKDGGSKTKKGEVGEDSGVVEDWK